jgi:predicted DNA-binding transcriptional regulator AlpA
MTDELLDVQGACELIGGNRPVSPATLYRGIKSRIYPAPIKISPNVSRWRKSELVEAIDRRIAARDGADAA